MDIERIREFCFLADTLNFSTTAKHFYMSQSVLSKHIASLEEEISAKLLTRDSHGVRLTEAGKAFREDALAITERYDRAYQRIRLINQSGDPVVTIGYLRGAAQPFMSLFRSRMAKKHPGIKMMLQCMEYGEARHAFSADTVDLLFGMDLEPDLSSRCDTVPVYRDCFYAVVSAEHPLARFDSITSDQLEGHKLLLPDPAVYFGMRDFVDGLLPEGMDTRDYRAYRDVDTLFLRVTTESYVGFSSGHNSCYFADGVKFLPITDRDGSYNVSAFAPRGHHPDEVIACLEVLAACHDTLLKRGFEPLAPQPKANEAAE